MEGRPAVGRPAGTPVARRPLLASMRNCAPAANSSTRSPRIAGPASPAMFSSSALIRSRFCSVCRCASAACAIDAACCAAALARSAPGIIPVARPRTTWLSCGPGVAPRLVLQLPAGPLRLSRDRPALAGRTPACLVAAHREGKRDYLCLQRFAAQIVVAGAHGIRSSFGLRFEDPILGVLLQWIALPLSERDGCTQTEQHEYQGSHGPFLRSAARHPRESTPLGTTATTSERRLVGRMDRMAAEIPIKMTPPLECQ